MKYEKWIPVLSLAGCYIEVILFPVLSLAGCYPLMQVRWVDQTQYPMIVVASLSAVPQSCRTLLPNQYLDCMLVAVYTHTPFSGHNKGYCIDIQISCQIWDTPTSQVISHPNLNHDSDTPFSHPMNYTAGCLTGILVTRCLFL